MKAEKLFLWMFVAISMPFILERPKPVFYIIGDSTVKNGNGKNTNQLQGWGSFIDAFFDTTKISIENDAIGGRSSRTFITDGRWDAIMKTLQRGDYLIMQFGHNDGGALDDTARARGTLKGISDDSVEIYNPIRKIKEVVHSYGWYIRKYVNEARAKGAIAIVCSPIPRDEWKDEMVIRSRDSYAGWAKQVAIQTGAYFIDLNDMIATEYEKLDTAKVHSFFPADHTHTNREGAILNAEKVIEGIKGLQKCKLKEYLR